MHSNKLHCTENIFFCLQNTEINRNNSNHLTSSVSFTNHNLSLSALEGKIHPGQRERKGERTISIQMAGVSSPLAPADVEHH